VHVSQRGLSQVPLFLLGTFQSHSREAGCPHEEHRRLDCPPPEQTNPRIPPWLMGVHGISE
jgi:hypothetical protein